MCFTQEKRNQREIKDRLFKTENWIIFNDERDIISTKYPLNKAKNFNIILIFMAQSVEIAREPALFLR